MNSRAGDGGGGGSVRGGKGLRIYFYELAERVQIAVIFIYSEPRMERLLNSLKKSVGFSKNIKKSGP
jgi:hypothetical protein